MKKINRIIVFVLLFMLIPAIKSNAVDESWKPHLADFLINNFPSLFDEATKKKNEKEFEKWNNEWVNNTIFSDSNYSDFNFSDDIVPYIEGNIVLGIVSPSQYYFYDLDYDGIPEVIVNFNANNSGVGWRVVCKFYDKSYKIIGTLRGGEYYEKLYINPDNRIVSVKPDTTQVFEIKNNEIVYSEYIDSTGSDSYKEIKYSEIGPYSTNFFTFENYEAFLQVEIFLADLRYIPQFDCSDVIESLKYKKYIPATPIAPKTRDMSSSIFITLGIISAVFIFAISRRRWRKTERSSV